MPAMNSLPMEAPVAIPYIIKGILGGMMTPRPAAVATTAPENSLSYPRERRTGMVMAPTAAQVAVPEPEIAP